MKAACLIGNSSGLTLLEVLVATGVVIALVIVLLIPAIRAQRKVGQTEMCLHNLNKLGLAYRVWEGDHGGKYPAQVITRNGGILDAASDNRRTAILNYLAMSNQLGSPEALYCPADKRDSPAKNFSELTGSNISYFVNLGAMDSYPQMVLSGDDNLLVNGLSVHPGLLIVPTDASVSWSADRHHGCGNIGLADGSAMYMGTNPSEAFQSGGPFTNKIFIP